MAEIMPFAGYRYRVERPEVLGDFVSPPYDMVDAAMVDELHARNPRNATRIIQNRAESSDTSNRDRHKRAAALFAAWVGEGRLVRDEHPSIYIYRQRFTVEGPGGAATHERTAVVALVRLTDYAEGIVQPHEYTLSGPKQDRLELLEEMRCDTGLIFGLVPDDGDLYRAIRSSVSEPAAGAFTDANGVEHALYPTSVPESYERIRTLVSGRAILIADGHHRYETALRYATEHGGDGYVMMALVSMADPGLVVRPFHRLVKKNETSAKFRSVEQLSRFFDIADRGDASLETVAAFLATPSGDQILYLDRSTRRLYGLSIGGEGETFLKERSGGRSAMWNGLGVSMINICCVEGIMELTLDGGVLHHVLDFVNDAQVAYRRAVESDDYTGVFFVRPSDIETVRTIVSAGERMPQKSTNFYPKVYSGLVFHKLENE